MTCPSHDAFQRLLDGAMSVDERATFQAHVDDCRDCEHELLRLVQAFAETLDGVTAPTRNVHLVDRAVGLSRTRGSVGAYLPSSGLEVGERVDHFEILSRLGRGGMGEVYLARDTRLHRKVALKVTVGASPAAVERFRREAQAMAQFSHPHIVSVFDVGDLRGAPYVAMELVEGRTLRDRMLEPVSYDEMLTIVRPIVTAMVEAHRRGIVHRDLKPANVMLGQDGRVRVLDFGLAAFLSGAADAPTHGDEEPASRIAVTGAAGTPRYMAPEQWLGEPVSGKTDVWALGVMIFEMLAGRPPFDGPTPERLLEQHLAQEGAPPLRDHAEVPPALDELVARCLSRDQGERPSAAELDAALRGLGPAQTSRWPLVAAAACLLVAGSAAGWSLASEKLNTTAPPPPPVTASATVPMPAPPPPLAVGDVVVARWTGTSFHEGTVKAIGAGRITVAWDTDWAPSRLNRSDVLRVPKLDEPARARPGEVVLATDGQGYASSWEMGEVLAVEPAVVTVAFPDSSDGPRNLPPSSVVVPPPELQAELREEAASAALEKAAENAGSPRRPEGYRPKRNERVFARYGSTMWYAGTVKALVGSRATIAWSDGTSVDLVALTDVVPLPTEDEPLPAPGAYVLVMPERDPGQRWIFGRVDAVADGQAQVTLATGVKRKASPEELVLIVE